MCCRLPLPHARRRVSTTKALTRLHKTGSCHTWSQGSLHVPCTVRWGAAGTYHNLHDRRGELPSLLYHWHGWHVLVGSSTDVVYCPGCRTTSVVRPQVCATFANAAAAQAAATYAAANNYQLVSNMLA